MSDRPNGMTYAQAGVDIDAGNALVERIKPLARSTARSGSTPSLGGFGALFDLKAAGYDDPLLDLEASRYHAQLVRKPIRPLEFGQLVNDMLSKVRRQRRWPRKRVEGGFRVTVKGRPAAVVDVSYGGLRLELPEPAAVSEAFDVEVAGIGLHLEVEAVWSEPTGDANATLCGATLAAEHTPSARTWRAIVDRLSA